MKLVYGVLCLVLLLEVYSCNPLSLDEDKRKPVDLNYICIHATNHKSDEAPILLLHGMFQFKETWYGVMPLLTYKTGRKVCAADLRNHGDSPWSDDFDTVVMAKDVERLLERLNFEKVVILGHSLGGKISVHFTLTNPEKVEKLIVEDMRPNGIREGLNVKGSSDLKDQADAALKAIPEGATELEAKRAVYNYFKDMNDKESENETFYWDESVVRSFPIKCWKGKCTWKSNIDRLDKAMRDLDVTMPRSQGQFDGPTLFIYGGKSPGRVGDVEEEILQLFPKAELVEVKEASHFVRLFPEFKDEVVKFINK